MVAHWKVHPGKASTRGGWGTIRSLSDLEASQPPDLSKVDPGFELTSWAAARCLPPGRVHRS